MQTPDGIGAHLSGQSRIREAHFRMLDLRTSRSGILRCGSNEDRRGRLAGCSAAPASVKARLQLRGLRAWRSCDRAARRLCYREYETLLGPGWRLRIREVSRAVRRFPRCFDLEPELQSCGTSVLAGPA